MSNEAGNGVGIKGDGSRGIAFENLILDLPAYLFLAGMLLSLSLAWMAEGRTAVILVFVAWWNACGAFMMFLDHRRRIEVLERLWARMARMDGSIRYSAPSGLRSTLCGMLIAISLKRRISFQNRQITRRHTV